MAIQSSSIARRFSNAMTTVIVSTLLLVGGGVIGWDFISFNKKLENRINHLSQIAESNLDYLLWNVDEQAMLAVLEALFKDEAIISVRLKSEGIFVWEKTKEAFQDWDTEQFNHSFRFATKTTDINFNNQVLGKLTITLSKEEAIQQLRTRLLISVGIIVIVVLLVVLSSLRITQRFIFKPLQALEDNAAAIAAGSMDTKIEVTGDDEIGRLAQSFEVMREAINTLVIDLRQANSRLEDHNNTLERRVAERTEKLLESEQRVSAIINNVVDGILTVDENGIIRTTNKAARTMFGYPEREMAGMPFSSLLTDDWQKEFSLPFSPKTGPEHELEIECKNKSGETFPVELAFNKVTQGRRTFFAGICRDITKRKELDRMKNEFLSTVSHELRTPLTAINGAMAMIDGADQKTMDDDSRNELLAIARKNCVRLGSLINDLLDIQKMEAGMMEFQIEPNDLSAIVHNSLNINQPMAKTFGVSFQVEEDLPGILAEVDPGRIEQVMANLLSNAAKFSPENSVVKIKILKKDGCVRVEVTDSGPGIPDQFKDQVFGKFAQVDSSSSRRYEGTGLGLAICQFIVQRHGGIIGFDSQENIGTTFFFELKACNG